MNQRINIAIAGALLGFLFGLPVPVSVGAQGGDAVYRSLRVQIPIERRYLEPQGLQDAATDLLTANFSTMSSSYQTIMSGSVTVGESGDAVLVHVTGQIGRMGGALYVVDSTSRELWLIGDPTAPGSAVLQGTFPSGLGQPLGITSQGGALYVVDSGSPDELWRVDDPTSPGSAVLEGSFPSGLARPEGITSQGGSLYVVDVVGRELWRVDDPTSPGSAVLEGSFPSGLASPQGITSHGGALYVVNSFDSKLWRVDDPTAPGSAVLQGTFPSGLGQPLGITSQGGALYVVDSGSPDELWRVDDPTDPGAAVAEGDFPSSLTDPSGIVSLGESPCMIRIARGGTEIEGLELDEGRILFDATFSDAPPVGTHTYSLQMRTQDPNTLCTAYVGDGTVPMPSLLVQSFYAGSIP